MYRSSAKRLSALIVSVGACLFLAGSSALLAAQKAGQQAPKVRFSVRNATSKPLRDHRVQGPVAPKPPREIKNKQLPVKNSRGSGPDPAVQRGFGLTTPAELSQFEGGSDDDNEAVIGGRLAPPDTNGDVGPNDYVQYINLIVTMYDKTGTVTLGPVAGNVFWEGLGGECEAQNDGDPIVLYDQLAQRWFVSQFAFPNFPSPPYIQCIAVSVTDDPTGAYHQYQFNLPDTYLNDYPKFGIWPDGYYMTFNGFDVFGGGFAGGAVAFDRTAMLAGTPGTMIEFDTGGQGGVLPSDLDGSTPPPVGSPNYFFTYDINPTRLLFWKFHADFATPSNSTFTGPVEVPVDTFETPVCGSSRDQCVPQLDSGELLETLSHVLMFRGAYRNFGTHEAIVANHTVDAGDGQAAIRWYEIRNPGGDAPGGANPIVIHQQSTFAPDANHRWMGSMAQDHNGNIALGYSISSEEMFPSIAITGRLATDPLNTMGAEDIWLAGTGSQVNTLSRWGDYSSMSVDPVDDCTFWYTQQYYQVTGSFDWNTRIGSFKYPGCSIGPTGTIAGTVTDGTNPIAGAIVTAGLSSTTTNAAGEYTINLPVGTYDMTATKYGYLPSSAEDVPVTEGNTTTQNFVLDTAPSQVVNGVVRDGSGGGWPLYARIQVSGPGYPGATFWTDPVTGYYQVTLVEGITYTFVITAVSPGYETGGGPLPLGVPLNAPFLVRNWFLQANTSACVAPGYTPDIHGLFEDFSGGSIPPGWAVENNSTDGGLPWIVFEGADPCGEFSGNLTGGTGPYAIVNSNCDGFVTDDTNLITPSVDFSVFTEPVLRFKSDYLDCCGSTIAVDISDDGGANWDNVFELSGSSDRGPKTIEIDLSAYAGSSVQARFHFDGFFAWWWQVDDVLLGEAGCLAGSGGLVVGTVNDDSTDTGLNGATVENIGGDSTTTFATPDPNQGDGFYILYAEAGNETFEASASNYESQQKSTLVVPGGTTRLDFSLLSGNLTAAPSPLSARLNPGETEDQTLDINNTGGGAANFEIIEINAPPPSSNTAGFAPENLRQQALSRLPRDAKGAPDSRAASTRGFPPIAPTAPHRVLAAGDVIASYPSGLTLGWGVATVGTDVWLSNLGVAGGDDLDHQYTNDGTKTGETIDDSTWIGDWAADGAFNPLTGNFWRVNVGGDNCLYELDPVAKVATGNSICGSPWAGISQRGVAYDVAGDTYFVGGWNEGVIYHIDSDGEVIDSSFVGLSISGLAYNPDNGHLLVMQNFPGGDDITVLDAFNNYAVLGAFPILDGGSPAITAFGGAGAEFDCLGNLWVIDQNTQTMYKVESGEAFGCSVDIPWLSVNPTSGTVASGATFPVTVTFDATGLLPGLRQAQLIVSTDTPHSVPPIPVNLTVRFLDVPDDNQFEAFIYAAAGAGIMMGGPPNCPAGILSFCPDNVVTRADMAGYIWRAVMGSNTPPPVYQNIFGDVTFNDYNAFYIQGIYDLGITAGCGNGNYCPDAPNTRAQMSVFIWKGEHGDEPPPACKGVFADVPCPGGFAVDYIEGLFNEGVTAGCGNGNFCPNDNITNGQMAVFLVRAFNIPFLAP